MQKIGQHSRALLLGTATLPFSASSPSKPHAKKAHAIATSHCTPQGVLHRAATLWCADHPGEEYSGTCHIMEPLVSASQRLGGLTYVVNGPYILHAIDKMNDEPLSAGGKNGRSQQADCLLCDTKGDSVTCPETQGFTTLMTSGGKSLEWSASGASDSDSIVETTMPAIHTLEDQITRSTTPPYRTLAKLCTPLILSYTNLMFYWELEDVSRLLGIVLFTICL